MSEVVFQGDEHVPIHETIFEAMAARSKERKLAPHQIKVSVDAFSWYVRWKTGGLSRVDRALDDPTSAMMLTCLGRVEIVPDLEITKWGELRFEDDPPEIRERIVEPIAIATDGHVVRVRNADYAQSMTIAREDIPALLVALDWAQEQFK